VWVGGVPQPSKSAEIEQKDEPKTGMKTNRERGAH
jgi:hypothetical protein